MLFLKIRTELIFIVQIKTSHRRCISVKYFFNFSLILRVNIRIAVAAALKAVLFMCNWLWFWFMINILVLFPWWRIEILLKLLLLLVIMLISWMNSQKFRIANVYLINLFFNFWRVHALQSLISLVRWLYFWLVLLCYNEKRQLPIFIKGRVLICLLTAIATLALLNLLVLIKALSMLAILAKILSFINSVW
jgi:hypothetical protein